MLGGRMAIKGQPHPHKVMVQGWIPHGACGIGQVAAEKTAVIRQLFENVLKAAVLLGCEGIVALISAGQVAVEAAEL